MNDNRAPISETDLIRRLTAERDALRQLVGELRAEIELLKGSSSGLRAARGSTMQGIPRVDGFVPTPTPPHGTPISALPPARSGSSVSGRRPASGRHEPPQDLFEPLLDEPDDMPGPRAPMRSDITPSPRPTPASPLPRVAAPDQGIDFGAVARLSPEELDSLPYGLITLDARGRVIHYNDTESRMVGLPKERVIGRSFFGEVAPCTRVREFEGRFLELVKNPVSVRVQTFDFVFRFARGEQQVTIVITPARTRGQYHLAILRRAIG
jgi:photoactive yellow protein